MKIYTKTGDQGDTALFAGGRVRKDHIRIATVGEIDELNALLGVVLAENEVPLLSKLGELLIEVQNRLFDLGAELATPSPEKSGTSLLQETDVQRLEQAIDHHEATLPPLTEFILPGGSAMAAQLHLARCVCRRVERQMVSLTHSQSGPSLAGSENVRGLPLQYINRLSDLLFVLARAANQGAGVPDTPWKKFVGNER